MAKKIVTEEMVYAVANKLASKGEHVSTLGVKALLGRGSLTTIGNHLKIWREENKEDVNDSAVYEPIELPEQIELDAIQGATKIWSAANQIAEATIEREREVFNEVTAKLTAEREELIKLSDSDSETMDSLDEAIEAANNEITSLKADLTDKTREASKAVADLVAKSTECTSLITEGVQKEAEAKTLIKLAEQAKIDTEKALNKAIADNKDAISSLEITHSKSLETARDAADKALKTAMANAEKELKTAIDNAEKALKMATDNADKFQGQQQDIINDLKADKAALVTEKDVMNSEIKDLKKQVAKLEKDIKNEK